MKKLLILTAICLGLIVISGCEQVEKLQSDSQKAMNDASQQVENLKQQAITVQNKFQEKVTQAQQAADAFNKLTR